MPEGLHAPGENLPLAFTVMVQLDAASNSRQRPDTTVTPARSIDVGRDVGTGTGIENKPCALARDFMLILVIFPATFSVGSIITFGQ
jgi:hypothetical protein